MHLQFLLYNIFFVKFPPPKREQKLFQLGQGYIMEAGLLKVSPFWF
jgi:hypothetical protein